MMRQLVIAFSLLVLLSGCMKEELPVPARDRGETKVMTICMGTAYQEQVWVDLGSGSIVSANNKNAWDLSFESSDDGWRIMLNGSRLLTAWNLGPVDITQTADTNGMHLGRRIDAPSGNPDSTALGDWRGTENVYLVDLGYNTFGAQMGYRKIKVNEVNSTSYMFEWAQLNGSGLQTVTLPKDPSRTFTYYSFTHGPQLIEPERGTWDVVFTQYTHQFYVPYLPYIVSGVLVDGTASRVSRIPHAQFEHITLADTLNHPFEGRRDIIGYDWKEYSFETSSYTVDQELCYIFRDRQGDHFKLRFIDFYSDAGQAGCPKFEVVPL